MPRVTIAAGLFLTAVACRSNAPTVPKDTPPTLRVVGTVLVNVETHGIPFDVDGYVVTARRNSQPSDTGITQRVVSNGSAMFSRLKPDVYTFELWDVAPLCFPSTPFLGNQRVVDVRALSMIGISFDVTCPSSGYGTLEIVARTRVVRTTDTLLSTAKWMTSVDGSPWKLIPVNGLLRFDSVAAGPHQIELQAGGCFVSPSNSRVLFGTKMTVMVPIDGTAVAAFSVLCVP